MHETEMKTSCYGRVFQTSKDNTLYPNECSTNVFQSDHPNKINPDTCYETEKILL